MISNLFVFEDEKFENFLPLVYMRPVYDLISGMSPLLAKIARNFPEANIHLHCRDYLKNIVKQNHAGIGVNNINTGLGCLLVNGRLLVTKDLNEALTLDGRDRLFVNDKGEVCAAYLNTNNLYVIRDMIDDVYSSRKITSALRNKTEITEVKLTLVEYLWELNQHNPAQLDLDFRTAVPAGIIKGQMHPQVSVLDEYKLFIGENSHILPGAILNAEKGPIYIGENCEIQPHTYIEGPAYIGNNTVILNSVIRAGSSIGPKSNLINCEISNSILHGYSTLDHVIVRSSYFGDNVCIECNTFNHELISPFNKDPYVYLNGKEHKPSTKQLGLIAADFAHIGPDVIINSGSIIGVATFFETGRDIMPKYLPSFIAQTSLNRYEELTLKEAIAMIEYSLSQKEIELTKAERDLLEHIHNKFTYDRKSSKIVY